MADPKALIDEDWLKSKFDKHPAIVVGGTILTVIGAAAVLRNVLQWIGFFALVMNKAIVVDEPGPRTSFHIQGWLFWSFAGLVSLVLASCGLLVQREIRLRQSKSALISKQTELDNALKNKSERSTVAFKTLQRTMWVATKIRDQHLPLAGRLKKSYKSIELEYRIHPGTFDVEFTNKSQIYATTEAVHFFTSSVQATSEAMPMEYLDDIKFKISEESGKDVVYQQIENDFRGKKVVVYFLPRIEPGEERPRQLRTTYTWPGLFAQLKTLRAEQFSWSAESVSDIEKVSMTFYYQKGTGDELVCEALS